MLYAKKMHGATLVFSQTAYDPQTSKLALKAGVIKNGVVAEVPTENIEDKPVASDGYGFYLRIRSPLIFRAWRWVPQTSRCHSSANTVNQPEASLFSQTPMSSAKVELWEKAKVTYISNSKLYTWVNDPEHVLKIEESLLPM